VAGPIVALRSDHDRELGTLYPAATWGDQVDRVAPNRGRLRQVRGVVARSAMGAVGVRGVGAPELDLVPAQRMGVLRRVVTIDGSRVVSSAPTATSTTTRSRGSVVLAAGLLTGGPAGARPRPVSPFPNS
jgi:hypothetical protein